MKAAEKLERQAYIGASDAAAILGIDRYRKPIDVWMEKTGRVTPRDDDEGNSPASWGRWLERVLLERWEHETGLPLTRSGRAPRRRNFVHREHPFIRATPDGYRLERGSAVPLYVVEAKTSRNGKGFGDAGTDEIPRGYKAQTIVQAAVTGAPIVHVPALIAGQDFRRYIIEPTEAQRAAVIGAIVEFWTEYVLPDREPPEVTEEYLRSKWPADDGEDLVATDADVKLAEALRLAIQNEEQAAAAVLEARTKIIQRIGERSRLIGPGFTISYKKAADATKTAWKELAGDLEKLLRELAGVGNGNETPEEEADTLEKIEFILAMHRRTEAGSRRFLPKFYEEDER
jgi:putative phage-type endonuclease